MRNIHLSTHKILGAMAMAALVIIAICTTPFSSTAAQADSQAAAEAVSESIPAIDSLLLDEGGEDEVASDTVVPTLGPAISAAEAFINLPRQELEMLPKSICQDMVDYMMADSIEKKLNAYYGLSWIEEMTPDYIRVHLTDASSLQIKILETKKSDLPLIMTIYTVGKTDEAPDSSVKFYDKEMHQLPASKYLTLPAPKSFFDFKSISKDSKKEILDEMPFYTMTFTIVPGSDLLTANLTISDYLTKEQSDRIQPLLRPKKQWRWNGKKFSPLP